MATTYEACQSYSVSGLKYENMGAIDGMSHPVVKIPWGKTVEVCGEEAPTPEAARADLQRVLAGMNGTTGVKRSNCTFIEDCSAKEQGDVQIKQHTSFWDSVLSFFRRFGYEVAETPSYGG